VQQILGCVLLLKLNYVYLVENAIQNIKLTYGIGSGLKQDM